MTTEAKGDRAAQAHFAGVADSHVRLAEAILEWLERNPPVDCETHAAYARRMSVVIAHHVSPIGVPALRRSIDLTTGEETGDAAPADNPSESIV